MATETKTVILFLRRRSNDSSKNIKLLTERFFQNSNDITINGIENPVSKYVSRVWSGLEYVDYISLIKKAPNSKVKFHDIYKEYIKKISIKGEKAILNEIIKRELDKLYYFILTFPQRIVVIKTGDKNEEKRFLGYAFSARRGSEGIHPVKKGRSIEECTQLFDPELFQNENKASTYIYQAFLNNLETPIAPSLNKNVSRMNLVDMINFGRPDFEKTISLSTKKKVDYKVFWGTPDLQYLCDIAVIRKGTSITKDDTVEGDIPVIAGGQEPAYMHNVSNRDGNVITVSASGAYAGYISYHDTSIFASDCNTIQSSDENNLPTKLLFIFLKTLQPVLYDMQRGQAQPHVYGEDLDKLRLPILKNGAREKILIEIGKLEKTESETRSQILAKRLSISHLVNSEISKSDERIRFNEIFHINNLSVDPRTLYESSSFTYVDIDSIGKGNGLISFSQEVLGPDAPSRARRVAEDCSAIISTVRPYLKGFAFLDSVPKNTIFSTGFAILKSFDEEIYLTKLVFYYFMYSSELMAQIEEAMPRVSYPSINKDDIENFLLPEISMVKQQSLVSSIEKLEASILILENRIKDIQNEKEVVLKINLSSMKH